MRSLFATIFAVTASASALPVIATSVNSLSTFSNSPIGQTSKDLKVQSVLPGRTTNNFIESRELRVYTFAQRSLNMAKQLPNSVLGMLIVDVNQDSWQTTEQFKIPAQNPLAAIDKLLSFLGQSSQLSFAKDVQPWLGTELAIAFLDNPERKVEVTFAALSAVSDHQQFEAFIKKLKGLDLPKPTERLYRNVKIWEWQLQDTDISEPEESPQALPSKAVKSPNLKRLQAPIANHSAQDPQEKPHHSDTGADNIPKFPEIGFKRLAIAKLPSGVAVIASDQQAIQQMIDLATANSPEQLASKPEEALPSLADNQLFLRSLNNPLWNRSLIAGYGDFKNIGQLWEALATEIPETTEIPGFSREEYIQGLKYTLSQYNSVDLFTWITPKGIRSQSNSYFSEVRSPQPKDTQTRDRLLSFLPSNVYGAITSRNLNRQWQWFVEESKLQPSYKILIEGFRMLAPLIVGSGLDIDLEKDVISWIDGEYALVLFPSDRAPFKEIGVDLTVGALIRTSKPEAANATLNKLTKYLTKVGKNFIQVKKRQVGTTLLTSFEFPDNRELGKTQSIFAYGWRDRQTLLLTLGASTASAFIPIPKPALAESEDFRDAIADMPQPNFGYFYLNANAIAKQVAKFLSSEFLPNIDAPNSDNPSKPSELPEPIQRAINKLGGAVFVYSETSDRFQSDFFLGIKH